MKVIEEDARGRPTEVQVSVAELRARISAILQRNPAPAEGSTDAMRIAQARFLLGEA